MKRALEALLRKLRSRSARRVIYTCMFGFSERFADREISVDSDTDLICFTDDPSLTSDRWKMCLVNSDELGPVKTSKMVKILAHRFVGEYSRSLYIDNTIKLSVPAGQIFQILDRSARPMVCFRHPERDCIYKAGSFVVSIGYDDPATVHRQMAIYREKGHPENAGLIAAPMLLRRQNDSRVQALMEAWFSEVRAHSYRDQLSFNFVARQHGFEPAYFEGSVNNNSFMQWPVCDGPRLPRGFRDAEYLALHPDIAAAGLNPREHFLKHGIHEGRQWKRETASAAE